MCPHLLVNCTIGTIVLYSLSKYLFSKTTHAPLPPGPRPKLLIGNLTDLPPSNEQGWVYWMKHRDLYGPISSVSVFGKTLIIINDQQIAFDLMERRSAIASSRPRTVFGGEMVGFDNFLTHQAYSERFRTYRKAIHSGLGTKQAVSRFNALQDIEVRRFLLRVLEEPERLLQHIRTESGAIILSVSYGYTIEPYGRDPFVDLAEDTLKCFTSACAPGVWLVDTLPFLKHVPDWMPGAGFKCTAACWRKTITDFVEKPFAFVKAQVADGVAMPSYTSQLLGDGELSSEDEFVVKWTAATLYAGGADTTVSALACFFLAMTVYPEVQRKAQEEIERVLDNSRLPGFSDRENLPYIDAIVKEVLRWHPPVPMGFPHTTTEDDTYEGYFIPKGSMLLPNVWGFTHDPETYNDPMIFKPERFLGINGRGPEMDPKKFVFGFGRRICPGLELADASLYLTIAQSLAVFNITKVVENGREVEPVVAFTAGILSHPVEYKTCVRPRSAKAEALIRAVEEEHPFQPGDAQLLASIKV